ncbi:MAG: GNAT family N-acetyltransferase [Chloroflexales bacterium]|nr:GNAT family N-acetyltransferase [Chloroflexales bacterium]
MDAATAWALFIAGFTDTAFARRAATRFRAGPLEAVHFAEGEVAGTPFAEFFAYGSNPAAALAAVAASRPPQRHYLTVLEDRPGLRETIERGGFRLDDTEALMALDLAAAPLPLPEWEVSVLRSVEAAEWHNANDPQGIRWALPANLADPRMAHYAIVRDGRLLARGRNFHLDAGHSYVSRVYTAEAHRGRGLARALMTRLLADDRARGARWSVLTASRMGEPLYARLGYRALGTILIFEAG